eukprot:g47737.t1
MNLVLNPKQEEQDPLPETEDFSVTVKHCSWFVVALCAPGTLWHFFHWPLLGKNFFFVLAALADFCVRKKIWGFCGISLSFQTGNSVGGHLEEDDFIFEPNDSSYIEPAVSFTECLEPQNNGGTKVFHLEILVPFNGSLLRLCLVELSVLAYKRLTSKKAHLYSKLVGEASIVLPAPEGNLAMLGPIHVFIKPAAAKDKLRVSSTPLQATLRKPQFILGSKMLYNLTVKVAAQDFQLQQAQIKILCNFHGNKLLPIEKKVRDYPRTCILWTPGSRLTIDGKRVRLNEIDSKTQPAPIEDHADVARKNKKRSRSTKKEAKGQNASKRPQQPARKKQKTTSQPEQAGAPRSPLNFIPSRALSQLERAHPEFSQLDAKDPAADTTDMEEPLRIIINNIPVDTRDVEPLTVTINGVSQLTKNPTEPLRVIISPLLEVTNVTSDTDDNVEICSQYSRDDRIGLADPSLVHHPPRPSQPSASEKTTDQPSPEEEEDPLGDSDGTDTGFDSISLPFDRKFSYNSTDGAFDSSGLIVPVTSSAVGNELFGTDSDMDIDMDTSGSLDFDSLFPAKDGLPNLHQPQHDLNWPGCPTYKSSLSNDPRASMARNPSFANSA